MEGTQKTEQHLANLFRAKFPILYIETWEENRVIDMVKSIAKDTKLIKTARNVYVWSSTTSMVNLEDMKPVDNTSEAIEALNKFNKFEENAILIMKDIHKEFSGELSISSNKSERTLRDIACSIRNDKDYSKNIVLIAPVLKLPVELEKDITVVDFPLPSVNEIKELLDSMIQQNLDENYTLSDNDKTTIAKTAQGLTLQEVENAFARALVERKKLTLDELDIIMEEKCQVIKKTGMLEFVKSDIKMDDIGGLDNLKVWLRKRNNSWSEKAQKDYNLPAPKGILITGVMGCAKSMTAKAMSSMWKLPLLRLDAGKIFNKYIGNSEENIRKVIKIAEAVSPSVLWIDEIEKGFAQGNGDSETTTRIFGTLLTWLNEKTKPVFIVATANNIDKLPAELLRKGRFDEIVWVDLPNPKERAIIFRLHLEKRLKGSISAETFKITDELINKLVGITEGFTGSEIEQVIIAGIFEAFAEDRTLQEEDLYNAIKATIPLSVTQKEQVEKIRTWAKERAVPASSK